MFVYNILGNMGTSNCVPSSGILLVVLGRCFSPTPAKLRPLEEVWLVPCASAKGGRWEGPWWGVISRCGLQTLLVVGVDVVSSQKVLPGRLCHLLRLSLIIQNSLRCFRTENKLQGACRCGVVVSHPGLSSLLLFSRTCIQETAGLSKDPRAIL